jgi:hypothetical protein
VPARPSSVLRLLLLADYLSSFVVVIQQSSSVVASCPFILFKPGRSLLIAEHRAFFVLDYARPARSKLLLPHHHGLTYFCCYRCLCLVLSDTFHIRKIKQLISVISTSRPQVSDAFSFPLRAHTVFCQNSWILQQAKSYSLQNSNLLSTAACIKGLPLLSISALTTT